MAESGEQQSSLKQFLASIATIQGDLSNITAPPFVLADKSTTEFPRYWIEQPELFCAPAHEQEPAKRILAVLKWFLSSLKSQQYAGRDPSDGVKKPLNAFLGEVFVGECGPEDDATHLIAEQVSHHPPVTACYLWNEKHGVRAEGYTRQEITFSGSVNIQQIGHAILHLDEFNEDYLIPLPDVKVKGIVTGSPYPELQGSHSLISSSGYIAEVDFSGKGMLGLSGEKNHVKASVYGTGDKKHKDALFTAEGSWSRGFDIQDRSGRVIDSYDVAAAKASDFRVLPEQEQDPWESRKAWRRVIESIHKGDMHSVANHKSELENAQRELRTRPETAEESWQCLFFSRESRHPVAEKLLSEVDQRVDSKSTCGVWRFNAEAAGRVQRPWRGDLTPFGPRRAASTE
ncbi:oxysterol bindin protein [Pseudocercospora fijiensis CIRAD86]|uniref:Oxysterol bindin protein n=1 Tax=Pseudocercospora fijiensis (strain CIRAD86) TaxID=383855 RepID=M2YZM2_PSEFD|nr:oxysterol bindin protein [Pseudocercospora fijiensis CIRAD86]EME83075.1 oxysterol bindin protein [Pseudocercospora fijiensis CIRAD86]